MVVAFLIIVLAACTANEDAGETPADTDTKAPETGEKEEPAEEEKVLYLNNGNEPTSFDPSVGFDSVSWSALNNLMEGLVRLSQDHQAEAATAEDIQISEEFIGMSLNDKIKYFVNNVGLDEIFDIIERNMYSYSLDHKEIESIDNLMA